MEESEQLRADEEVFGGGYKPWRGDGIRGIRCGDCNYELVRGPLLKHIEDYHQKIFRRFQQLNNKARRGLK